MLKKWTTENILTGLTLLMAVCSLTMGMTPLIAPSVLPDVTFAVALLLTGLLQIGIVWLFRKRIVTPLRHILKHSQQLAGGQNASPSDPPAKDRLSQLADSINRVATDVKEATDFAVSIGNGHLDTYFEKPHHNPLKKTLEEMRDKLQVFTEQDKKRTWQAESMARFNELLRHNHEDTRAVYFSIIKQLVQDLGGNQGGLYLLEEGDEAPYLELAACYAFERRKYHQQRIEVGEGLLGQCIREKDIIYLTDIPEDYIQITSGLGKANPRCILIVPLKHNDIIEGAIEVASFAVLEPFQVELVENLSQVIAATLASFKTSRGMAKVLQESQELNSRLQLQEEVTQQNMEELQRTQIDMQRNVRMLQAAQDEMLDKQMELTGLFNSINTTLATLEFDPEGNIFHANEHFLNLLGYRLDEIQGRHHQTLFDSSYSKNQDYEQFWPTLRANQSISDDFKILSRDQSEKWLSASYTPALDAQGNVYKVIMLAQDVTERKKEQLEFQKLSMVADHTHNSVVITNAQGLIEFVNKGFIQTTGYTLEEVLGRKPGNFLQGPDTNVQTVQQLREAIRAKESVYAEILNYKKTGETYWISISINPVFDAQGKVEKFISIQADITQTKKDALDFQCKLNAISASNAIVEFDLLGKILEANDNFLSIVGYNQAELLGQHHRIFLPPSEHQAPEYLNFWKRINAGESIYDEFRRITKSGREVWLRGNYTPIFDLNGQPYKIVKFAVDITSEKNLELVARRQERQLQEYLKAIDLTIASVEFDIAGRIREVNPIFLGVTGYQKEELVGQPESVLLSEEEVNKPQHELMWSNLKAGKFFEGEFKLRNKNGKALWLKGTYNPIFDLDGHLAKITMLAQFTTDEKEKETELSGVINALKHTVLVLELNPDGTFRNANQKLLDWLGYKRMELRNQPLSFLLSKATPSDAYTQLLERIGVGETMETPLDILTSGGKIHPVRAHFHPLTNLEGKIHRIVIILAETVKS